MRFLTFFLIFSGCLLGMANMEASIRSDQETIDGIVALVNEEVITLTDVRLASSFGLITSENPSLKPLSLNVVLQRMIDQKLIIRMTSESITVSLEEIENFIDLISQKMGAVQMQQELENFDLTREDLMEYIEENLLYAKILAVRFDRAVTVSLGEIETYYNQIYIPEKRAAGQEPQPMVAILNELEAAVKSDKTSDLEAEWISNLREAADIRIFTGRYPEYFAIKSGTEQGVR